MAEIRRMQPGDEQLWLAAVASILSEEDRDSRIASAAELAPALEDPRCILFVALSGTQPVALLSAHVFPDVAAGGKLAYLYDIEVLEAHQRAGIGRALVETLMQQCEADGVRLIWAGTEAGNAAARSTFETTDAELVGDSYAEYEWEIDQQHPAAESPACSTYLFSAGRSEGASRDDMGPLRGVNPGDRPWK